MSNPAPSLKALAESKTEGVAKATTFRVNPDLITFEEGFNLRAEGDDLDFHIERLYQSMKAGAFMPPVDVAVVNGVILARDGHCRTRAARRLKLEMPEFTLECRQLRGNDADAVLHMLGTGSGSKPLTPLEQGRGYLRLVNMGLKPSEIAAKLGVSRVTVDNGLTLAEAPVEVQQMVADGEVSGTMAREAIKQGADGIEALKSAVIEERAKPTKKKNGKKGKVTAKKLRGTKAEKGAKAKTGKPGPAKTAIEDKPDGSTTELPIEQHPDFESIKNNPALAGVTKFLAPNGKEGQDSAKLTLSVTPEVAKAAAEFLRAFGGDDASLKEMAATLETALM